MAKTKVKNVPVTDPENDRSTEIVQILQGYWQEADEARKNGLNRRDDTWEQNLNLYYNRYDFSDKADWQSQETMPEVPNYVDRFAAALKEAVVASGDAFYTVVDPYDKENDLADAIKRMTDVWLSTLGRNQVGQVLGFPAVFEEQMKMGAITALSGAVLWKEDVEGGRVAFETVDPRFVWLDPTYRNLYRVRRTEIDRHELVSMAKMQTKSGKPIFRLPEMDALVQSVMIEDQQRREEMAGHGMQQSSTRVPITLDEYIATVVGRDGKVLAKDALMVVANDRYLIRGPEDNPYWHGKDWMVYAPLVTTPLSVYGRSYMEDFGSIAQTFTKLTNLILDAVQTSAIKAYVMVPGMLLNPEQVNSGISPNKTFLLEEGYRAEDFAKVIDSGELSPSAYQVWQALKTELSEAASINEIGMGQFAPNSRTSATEVNSTQQSSSAMIRSVAQTVETRFADPLLDLVWKTGLQKTKADDRRMVEAVGEQMWPALMGRRKELIKRNYTFQARGISQLIAKNQMLSSLLNLMQVIAGNPNLLAAFMAQIDINKLVTLLFRLSNVDITKMQLSEREKLIKSIAQPMQQAAEGSQPSAPGMVAMGGAAQALGVGA